MVYIDGKEYGFNLTLCNSQLFCDYRTDVKDWGLWCARSIRSIISKTGRLCNNKKRSVCVGLLTSVTRWADADVYPGHPLLTRASELTGAEGQTLVDVCLTRPAREASRALAHKQARAALAARTAVQAWIGRVLTLVDV